jgi:sortase A
VLDWSAGLESQPGRPEPCSTDYLNFQMTSRHKLLAGVESSLGFVGVTLLTLFVGAMIYRDVTLRLGLRNFDRSRSIIMQAPQELLNENAEDEQLGLRLWSTKRIRAYRESLALTRNVPLAVLRMDKFRIRVPVFEGTDELTLNRGAGWIVGTARPGEIGNIGIAGHRDGSFRALKDIALGDPIELSTTGAKATYAVDEIEIVDPTNVGVLLPRRLPSITLTTCYPFYFIGDAPQRFIVHAALRHQTEVEKVNQGSVSARTIQLNSKENKK